jgi:hypothetical protein
MKLVLFRVSVWCVECDVRSVWCVECDVGSVWCVERDVGSVWCVECDVGSVWCVECDVGSLSRTTVEQLQNEINALDSRIKKVRKEIDRPSTEKEIKLQMGEFLQVGRPAALFHIDELFVAQAC